MAAATTPDLDREIVSLVSRGAIKVPPYPAVAMKIQKLVRESDYGLDQLTRLVQSDQALAADALRVANSAFYVRGNGVSTLSQAIGRIGAQEVARLAIASGLGTHARAPGPLAPLKRRVWLESLASAGLCQELAKKRALPAEEAFVCGLLHDFGKIITIACVEEILEKQAGAARPAPLEYWLEVVERYHVELGLVMAARWELPSLVSDVISLHHGADAAGAADPRMVSLVKAADEVVKLLEQRTWLGAEDLAHIRLLDAPECELVARVLDRLPGFIASFEGASTALPAAGSAHVRSQRDPAMSKPAHLDCAVKVTVNRQTLDGRAVGVSANNLIVRCKAPLPENLLMELRMSSDPALHCWATAKLSWPDAGMHAVLLQPFALNGPAQAVWSVLAGGARPEANRAA